MFRDLREGIAMGPAWRAFAWDEIQNRYRRSLLGVAWIGVGYFIFVVGIAIFFGPSANDRDFAFVHHVAIGYACFTFITGNITDGCAVFSSASTWIKSAPLPLSLYVYKSIARSMFPFGVQMLVALVLLILTGWQPTVYVFLIIPALIAYILSAVWIQFLFGFSTARFGDIAHLVTAIVRILIFATPILWVMEDRTGLAESIALLNPLTHFIEIFRAPFLGEAPSLRAWLVTLTVSAIGWIAAIVLVGASRRRLTYWV